MSAQPKKCTKILHKQGLLIFWPRRCWGDGIFTDWGFQVESQGVTQTVCLSTSWSQWQQKHADDQIILNERHNYTCHTAVRFSIPPLKHDHSTVRTGRYVNINFISRGEEISEHVWQAVSQWNSLRYFPWEACIEPSNAQLIHMTIHETEQADFRGLPTKP